MTVSDMALRTFLEQLIDNQPMHHRWLATLSFLENQGARKIFRFQPTEDLPLDLLQHAAEEARHAWLFKKLLTRIGGDGNKQYRLLGGLAGRRYLDRLDMGICRWLGDEAGMQGRVLKKGSYLLTTYAIEVRAAALYPLYSQVLKAKNVKLSLASVIQEEDRHLAQITSEINAWPELLTFKERAVQLETRLYETFLNAAVKDAGLDALLLEGAIAIS